MRRVLAIATLIGAALAGTAAFAHDPPAQEPQRPCVAYRPHGAVPGNSPVEARKDSNGNNITGICTSAGVVRVGTTQNGAFVAVDGSRGANVLGGMGLPPQAGWTQGYALITADPNGVHGYCAGGGQYENGAQPDDEFMTGDCGKTGLEPSPEPSPSDTSSPSPSPSP